MIDLALITARAGSQGLPGKNVAELGGVPLIAWTVRAVLASGLFDRVVVSTDGAEIAAAARAAGAEVPFLRPADLATAEARSVDVVRHALQALGVAGRFALLQPTSPFRNAHHLRAAAERLEAGVGASLVSVVGAKPASWHFRLDEAGRLHGASAVGVRPHRRQDTAPLYTPNGAIYLSETERFLATMDFYSGDTIGYEMSRIDSLDIDDPEDLELARAIVAQRLRTIDG